MPQSNVPKKETDWLATSQWRLNQIDLGALQKAKDELAEVWGALYQIETRENKSTATHAHHLRRKFDDADYQLQEVINLVRSIYEYGIAETHPRHRDRNEFGACRLCDDRL